MIEEPISGIRDADLFSQMLYIYLFYRTDRGFFGFLPGNRMPGNHECRTAARLPVSWHPHPAAVRSGHIFPFKDWSDWGIPDPVHISFTNCVESGMEPRCCLFHREHADIFRQILIHIGADNPPVFGLSGTEN